MSLAIFGNEISTTYQGNELKLVKEVENGELWNKHPVIMTDSEISTLNWSHVQNILTRSLQPPSEMAGIKKELIQSIFIETLDQVFGSSMKEYVASLTKVNINDSQRIRSLERNYKLFPRKGAASGGVLSAVSSGGYFLAGKLNTVGMLLISGVGAAISYFGTAYLKKKSIDRDGSAHRIAWLKEIDIKEKARYHRAEQVLKIRARVLKKTMEELADDNEYDTEINRESEQIEKIFNAMFPNENLATWLLNN